MPLVDHTPPVAIVTPPFRFTIALLAQTLISAPAVTTGASVIVTIIWSVTARHPPLFVEVSVSVTVPAAVSAGLKTYDPLSPFGEKVPEPLVVHVPNPVEDEPESRTGPAFAQSVWSMLAETTGGCVYIMLTVSVTALHNPLPVLVSVSNTDPFEISEGDGMYCALSAFALGLKLPVPLVVQVALPVEEDPLSVAFGLLLQRNIVAPASTVGASVMVTTIESITAKQVPFPVEVR